MTILKSEHNNFAVLVKKKKLKKLDVGASAGYLTWWQDGAQRLRAVVSNVWEHTAQPITTQDNNSSHSVTVSPAGSHIDPSSRFSFNMAVGTNTLTEVQATSRNS